MNEVMTILEIQDRFDAEWVLLADPVTSDSLRVLGGRLLWHSKDRDEIYRKAREIRPEHSAILYTGGVPEDEHFVL